MESPGEHLVGQYLRQVPTDFMVTIRVFTHAGSRDYELELNKQT